MGGLIEKALLDTIDDLFQRIQQVQAKRCADVLKGSAVSSRKKKQWVDERLRWGVMPEGWEECERGWKCDLARELIMLTELCEKIATRGNFSFAIRMASVNDYVLENKVFDPWPADLETQTRYPIWHEVPDDKLTRKAWSEAIYHSAKQVLFFQNGFVGTEP